MTTSLSLASSLTPPLREAEATGVLSLTWLLVALPLMGAAVLLLGGRRADRWGHLLGTGTVSGPADHQRACLAEITEWGRAPLRLADGTTRRFLEDGDEIALTARAHRDGFVPIGFGECRATIAAAPAWPD